MDERDAPLNAGAGWRRSLSAFSLGQGQIRASAQRSGGGRAGSDGRRQCDRRVQCARVLKLAIRDDADSATCDAESTGARHPA